MSNIWEEKKLNSKQATIITLIISGIYFIYMLVNGLVSNPTGNYAVYYWLIGCIAGTILVFYSFYFFIFDIENKKISEKEEKIRNTIGKYLSNTEYKQVRLIYKDSNMLDKKIQDFQEEGCKFFAKIIKDDCIELIAKDSQGKKIYSAEIENLIYFFSYFEFR